MYVILGWGAMMLGNMEFFRNLFLRYSFFTFILNFMVLERGRDSNRMLMVEYFSFSIVIS